MDVKSITLCICVFAPGFCLSTSKNHNRLLYTLDIFVILYIYCTESFKTFPKKCSKHRKSEDQLSSNDLDKSFRQWVGNMEQELDLYFAYCSHGDGGRIPTIIRLIITNIKATPTESKAAISMMCNERTMTVWRDGCLAGCCGDFHLFNYWNASIFNLVMHSQVSGVS